MTCSCTRKGVDHSRSVAQRRSIGNDGRSVVSPDIRRLAHDVSLILGGDHGDELSGLRQLEEFSRVDIRADLSIAGHQWAVWCIAVVKLDALDDIVKGSDENSGKDGVNFDKLQTSERVRDRKGWSGRGGLSYRIQVPPGGQWGSFLPE